jgi:hypothetical protein
MLRLRVRGTTRSTAFAPRRSETIAPHFEHRLFLTATPHNGNEVSFTSLLEPLDDQRFARGVAPDQDQLARAMVLRLKTEITDAYGDPVFPKRKLVALEVDYSRPGRPSFTDGAKRLANAELIARQLKISSMAPATSRASRCTCG